MAWKSKSKTEQMKRVSNPLLAQTPIKKPAALQVLQLNNKLFERHILPYVKPLEENATQEQRREIAVNLLKVIHIGGSAKIIYKKGTKRTIKSPNQVLTPEKDEKLMADCDELAFLYFSAAKRLNLNTEDFSILEIKLRFSEGNTNHAVVLNLGNELFEFTTGKIYSIGEISDKELSKIYTGETFNKKKVLSASLISISKGERGVAANYYDKLGGDLLRRDRWKKGIEYFEKAYNLEPTRKRKKLIVDYSLKKGEGALQNKKYQDAEIYLKKTLKYDKVNAGAHYNLGVCYSETGHKINAITEFKKATSTSDKKTMKYTYHNLLSLQIETNDLEGAEETIKEIEQKKIETARICSLMGDVHRIRGRHKEAIGAYDKSIMLDKKYLMAYHNKATMLYNLGGATYEIDKHTEAETYFKQALEVVKKGMDNCSSDVNYPALWNFKKKIEKRLKIKD